jgi:uncharacterized protein YhaN
MRFNLTPWIEIQPRITLEDAAAEMKKLEKKMVKLELEINRIKTKRQNLKCIIEHLEKKHSAV